MKKREVSEVCSKAASLAMNRLNLNHRDAEYGITDKIAEEVYLDVFLDEFDSFVFFSEESGRRTVGLEPEFTLVLDPIDGSENYYGSIPIYGTAVSAFECTSPSALDLSTFAAGAIRTSVGHKLNYTRETGPENSAITRRVSSLDDYFLRFSHIGASYQSTERIKNYRLLGASIVEIAMVVAGEFDAFIDYGGLKATDIAPLVGLRECIDIEFYQPCGSRYRILNLFEQNLGLLAMSPEIHNHVMSSLTGG